MAPFPIGNNPRMRVPVDEIRDPDFPHPMSRFFEGWRNMRREHYASRPSGAGAEKRRAIITIVSNEPVFFPIWLSYYSRFFSPDDIYVLDHQTDDGSLDKGDFVRIPVRHGSVDHVWMMETIRDLQHQLLETHEVVVVTDVDEIVAPRPEQGTLGDYIDHLDEDFVNAIGYELIHLADREPPYRDDLPVMDQRHFWFANDAYDKPAIAMVPMDWKPGFHERVDAKTNFDPDLFLIHLHRMDYEICRDRHALRRKRRWGEKDIREGWAAHHRIRTPWGFRKWFYRESGLEAEGISMEIQEIPAQWRGLF